MPLASGLCSLDGWELDPSCMDIPPDTPPEVVERWRLVAAELLWGLTGRQFGPSCPVTVRPCRRQCAEGFGLLTGRFFYQGAQSTGPFIPYMRDGRMYNATLCGCSGDCHCGPELCEIYLPGPIYDVVAVDISGELISPDTYNVLDGRYLVRRSDVADDTLGGPCWPACQDMSLPPGEEGTFTVTYRTGVPLPAMGVAALSELAAHYIRGCNGCGCGVGTRQNLQRLSRQGVDLQFQDAQETLADGRTGLPLVDLFIQTVNPSKLPQAMRVLSPDAPRRPRIWYGPTVI